jgi:hypothetical protein
LPNHPESTGRALRYTWGSAPRCFANKAQINQGLCPSLDEIGTQVGAWVTPFADVRIEKIAITFTQLFTTSRCRIFVFLCPKSQVTTCLTTVHPRTTSMIGLLKITAFALQAGVWLVEI